MSHADAVKAAASALSVHLGDPGDWYDIAAVAVAAAAPVLLAPVQAEVERLRDACRQGVHFVDDLRRVQRKLAAERDEARAEVARLRAQVAAVEALRDEYAEWKWNRLTEPAFAALLTGLDAAIVEAGGAS